MVASYGIYFMLLFLTYVLHGVKVYIVWPLPCNIHTALLAPLSDSISLMDEICQCTLSFTVDCLSSNCNLISFVSR